MVRCTVCVILISKAEREAGGERGFLSSRKQVDDMTELGWLVT